MPPGLVVSAAAFRAGLQRSAGTPSGTPPSCDGGPSGGILAPWISAEIAAGYRRLANAAGEPEPVVAVRSSGVGEDGGAASAAGQYLTLLGVAGASDVIAAVETCHASAAAPSARRYQADRGRPSVSPMAVGVQLLVPARVAGTSFSAHPLDPQRDCVVVEAVRGLGAPAAAGTVRPEHIEMTRAGRVLRREPARQAWMQVAGPVGVREEPVDHVPDHVLDDAELDGVVEAVLAVETCFGFPVDVEWAVASPPGEPVVVILLQARPITWPRPLS